MKLFIIALPLILLVSSCGKKAEYIPTNANPTIPTVLESADNETQVGLHSMEASKSYSPVSYQDGVLNLSQAYEASIPATIYVIEGNAGNHNAEIHYDSSITCVYKGASSFTNPLYTDNLDEIKAGKKYIFQYCKSTGSNITNAYGVGNKIIAQDRVIVSVKNGDSQAKTKVQVNIFLTKP